MRAPTSSSKPFLTWEAKRASWVTLTKKQSFTLKCPFHKETTIICGGVGGWGGVGFPFFFQKGIFPYKGFILVCYLVIIRAAVWKIFPFYCSNLNLYLVHIRLRLETGSILVHWFIKPSRVSPTRIVNVIDLMMLVMIIYILEKI